MNIPAVAVVIFPSEHRLSDDELRRLLKASGEKYTNIPGLQRKYFLAGEDSAGGIYEWDCMASAQAFYDEDWYQRMQSMHGVRPSVRFFESPAIADGIEGRLQLFI